MYHCARALTSALDACGWLTSCPNFPTPGRTQYPLYMALGGPQGRSEQVRKISTPQGFDLRTLQPSHAELCRMTGPSSVPALLRPVVLGFAKRVALYVSSVDQVLIWVSCNILVCT